MVGLKGKSLMSYCYFELEDLDYISGSRRNLEMKGLNGVLLGFILDFNIRVIEFSCIGIGVKNIKYVFVCSCLIFFIISMLL